MKTVVIICNIDPALIVRKIRVKNYGTLLFKFFIPFIISRRREILLKSFEHDILLL